MNDKQGCKNQQTMVKKDVEINISTSKIMTEDDTSMGVDNKQTEKY